MTEKSPTKAELSERLEQVEVERDEYLADLKRVAAEFENYRKRAVRDDLERALEAAAEHEEAKLEEGVRLVPRELRDALAKEGLVEIETNGSFDPHVHEALLTQPSAEDEGSIIEVIQKGYRLGDRVVRPARVVISQGASSA